MKYLMILSLLLAFNIKAETTSDDLTLADESIQSPTLNIEGQYKVQEPVAVPAPASAVIATPLIIKKLSQSDKLKIFRERLEERNKIMIEKKIEQIRFKQELALAHKLEQSMNQTLRAIDTIQK
jgi:hypothetical protein